MNRPRFAPVLALLMQSRILIWVTFSVVAVHLLLARFSIELWRCSFRDTTGLPCPGCGLTRAGVALLRGDWQAALVRHPFVLIFVSLAALLLVSALLPAGPRARFMAAVERVERRTGVVWICLAAFVVYGTFRLILAFG